MKKIFFANSFASLEQKLQSNANFKIIEIADANGNNFVNACEIVKLGVKTDDVEALLVRTNCSVDAQMLDLFPSARLILRVGHGFDNIDVAECCKRGIFFSRKNAHYYVFYGKKYLLSVCLRI